MAGSIASVLNGTKSVMRFVGGSWATPVGTAFRKAHLDPNIKATIFNFDWKGAYCDSFKKTAAKAAGEAAKKGGFWHGVGNLLGKIPGAKFLGRNFGPILIFGPMLLEAISEFREGGIISGAKQLIKGGIGWTGWGIGTCIAAACGFTGLLVPFVLGMAVSSIAQWGAGKVFGPSIAEQKAELAEKQQASPYKLPDFQAMDRNYKALEDMYAHRFDDSQSPFGPRRTFMA